MKKLLITTAASLTAFTFLTGLVYIMAWQSPVMNNNNSVMVSASEQIVSGNCATYAYGWTQPLKQNSIIIFGTKPKQEATSFISYAVFQ